MTDRPRGDKVVLSPETLANIDPEIRSLVAELNASGYATTMSCAGHHDPSTNKVSRGWLMFAAHWSQQGIAAMLTKHNLTGVRLGFPPNMLTDLLATFDPIGQPRDLYDLMNGVTYDALDDANDYPQPSSENR